MRLGSVQEFLKERELQRTDWRRKPLPKKILSLPPYRYSPRASFCCKLYRV